MILSKITREKEGQMDYPIVTWIVVLVGLLIIAPVMLKVFMSVQSNFAVALNNSGAGGVKGEAAFNHVLMTGINMWDKVIIFAFFISLIMLFISAFLIDAHPLFIILYIFLSFMVMLFAPSIMDSMDKVYSTGATDPFKDEVAKLTFMDWVRSNFAIILVGVMVITGIIIYGKVALFPSRRQGGNY